MPNTLIALGEFRFAVDTATFDQLEQLYEWRWESNAIIDEYPAHQYVGPDTPEITFRGTVYPSLVARMGTANDPPIRQIAALREQANRGVPLDLVDGMGRVWGLWVILRIEETQHAHLANSAPREQQYRVTIRFFGEGVPNG